MKSFAQGHLSQQPGPVFQAPGGEVSLRRYQSHLQSVAGAPHALALKLLKTLQEKPRG